MQLSNEQALKSRIEDLKTVYGLDDNEVKKLFIKSYLIDSDEPTANELMSGFLHPEKK